MAVFIDSFMKRLGCKNQQELADKLGISQGSVSAWGSGSRSPRYEDCVRLLQMGMTVEELFGISEAEKNVEKISSLKDFVELFQKSMNETLDSVKKNL